ncbi:MAG: ATP-binding protein [Bdellovibrionota bacterium]|nr:ATP-binding protein [Bdellovibrionota bacterium]
MMDLDKNSEKDLSEELKKKETELKKEKQYSQTIIESLSDPLVITNEEGDILVTNQSFRDLVSYLDVINENIRNFIYHREGEPFTLEEMIVDTELTCFFVWGDIRREVILSRREILNQCGQVQNMLMFKDITNFNKQLREYASFAKLNPSPVFRINAQGDILHSNIEAKKVISMKDNVNWFSISEELNKERALEIILSNEIYTEEIMIEEMTYYFQYKGIKSENYINVYGFDVTEEKLNEQKIRQLQDELVNDAYSQGVAENSVHVLHNIGNVLTSMIGKGDFLKKDLAKKSVSQAFSMVLEKLEKMKVEDLNEESFSKLKNTLSKINEGFKSEEERFIEANEFSLKESLRISEIITTQQKYANLKTRMNSYIKVSDLVNDLITVHKYRIDRRNIKLNMNVCPHSTMFIEKIGMSQTISNAIINAIESIDEKAKLGYIEKEWQLDIHTEIVDDQLALIVSDNGVGISKENLKKLFGYGFSTKERGSGFGLHNCANYMQTVGGSIEIQSDGELLGARTIIKVPLVSEEEVA